MVVIARAEWAKALNFLFTAIRRFLVLQGKVEEAALGEEGGKPAVKRQEKVLRAMLFIVQRVIALQKITVMYAGESEENALINASVPG